MQISKRFLLIFGFGILVSTEVIASEGWQLPPIQTASNPTTPVCCIGNIPDDFGDGNLLPLWINTSNCGTPVESGGQLVLEMTGSCGAIATVAINLNSAYTLCGDFDVQVDFDLVNWPPPIIGLVSGLHTYDATNSTLLIGIQRFRNAFTSGCVPFLESYKCWLTNTDNCASTWIATNQMQGKLRIARSGSTMSGYYWDGVAWILAISATTTTGPIGISLFSASDNSSPYLVRYDNLNIQSQAPADVDGDTVPDCRDNCPLVSNSNQSDVDSDTVGDSCDICPNYFNPLQQVIKPGDANASGTYALGDIISIVNYIFNKAGCSPQPLCWLSNLLCRGDWNGDSSVGLTDVIRGVNYIFNKPGGPWAPVPVGACCVSPT